MMIFKKYEQRKLKTTRRFVIVFCLCALIVSAHTACLLVPNLDINQGVLAAIPGTKLSDLRRESTLNIGDGVKSMVEVSRRRTFQQSKRFDWRLPNSNLLFKGCNSYSIYTDETGETVVDMQIGTAQKYLTWAQVKAEVYDIEQRLFDDGWQVITWKDDSSFSYLHRKLENPDFNQNDDSMGGATYRKDNILFTISVKRANGKGTPEIANGQNFLHYINIRFKRDDENY